MKAHQLSDGRREFFLFDTQNNDRMVIRVISDPADPLYDPAALAYKPEQHPERLKYAVEQGVRMPIQLRRAKVQDVEGKEVWEIIAGNKRKKDIEAANEILAKDKRPLHMLPWTVFTGSELNAQEWNISENELRSAQLPTSKARKAARLVDAYTEEEGMTEAAAQDRAAVFCGVPKSTVKTLIKLNDAIESGKLDKTIAERLDNGEIELTHVAHVLTLDVAAQLAVLETAMADAKGHGKAGPSVSEIKAAKAKKGVAKGKAQGRPGVREHERIICFLEEKRRRAVSDASKDRLAFAIELADFLLTGLDPKDQFTPPEGWEPKPEKKEGEAAA